MTDASLPRYLAIAGPTASGKTAAALALAEHARQHWQLPVEIVSVDSALVYRQMDIGTAKPSAEELALAPHHLVNLIDPLESYSAARFVQDASAAMQAIQSRGHLPLLVGGTMLYFKALFEGLNDMPATDPAIRAQIEQEALRHGWPALHARLQQVDATTAHRLAPNDSQRIGRALEVWHQTGKPLSHWHAGQDSRLGGHMPLALLSLEPSERGWLHQRIALRFDAMLAAGFEAEVRQLRQRGDLDVSLPSIRCVGYRQAWEGMDQGEPVAIWREKALAATRQLAKRQLTWLRSMPWRQTIACDQPDAIEQLIRHAADALQREPASAWPGRD